MELNFVKNGNIFVAEAEVNDDYNVKVECEKVCDITVQHKTCGTKFAVVSAYPKTDVIDDDFDGCVFPKTIRVTATEEPTFGAITEAQ